jgi:pilus assembly protein Flp/PilA
MMEKEIKQVEQREEGATMLEYALLAALIAVVCIGAVTFLGGRAQVAFSTSAVALSNAN